MTLTYFLINMKKMSSYDQRLTASVRVAQYADSVLPLEYLKKNGESGAEFTLKTVRCLENLTGIVLRNTGQKPGKA